MPRPAQFSSESILDATARLAARSGPAGATISAIAEELGAPTGSIYYRFPSRDVLLAELWMHTVEGFQSGFIAELSTGDARSAGLQAALFTPRWVRTHPVPARILLLHHRDDFLPGGWPPELAERAQALRASMDDAIRSFAKRAFGSASAANLRKARFALIEVPGAAVGPHVRAGEDLPADVDELIRSAFLDAVPARPPNRRS